MDTSNVDTSNVDTYVDTNVDTNLYKQKSNIEQSIIDVCQEDYISVEEIAQKVGRAVKYLKNKIIPEMVKIGYLIKLYPQTNHPQQKYISKSK
jgi:predicted transcriptional regulator